MPTTVTVHEAVEWREPAPGGGSQAQVFRLGDGRFAIVKFPENQQGERVLANEFLSCRLAELLALPVNEAVLVSIDERLLRQPRSDGRIPSDFSAGIRCGLIRFENPEGAQPSDIQARCANSHELHSVAVFEEWVARLDSRQLLMYPGPQGTRLFAAYDYGYAFGGQPHWSIGSISSLTAPTLPVDPFTNQPYQSGDPIAAIMTRLQGITVGDIEDRINSLAAPRWAVTPEDLAALGPQLKTRAEMLIAQFTATFRPQLEAF